jgi:tetratricopeptide (TPR) repeat protein
VVIGVAIVLLGLGFWYLSILQNRPTKKIEIEARTADTGEKKEFQTQLTELDKQKPADGAPAKEVYTYYFNKGNAHSAVGEQAKAIEAYKKAQASGHTLTSDFYVSLGLAYELNGDKGNAKKAYEQAITLINNDPKQSAEDKEGSIQSVMQLIERVR